MLNSRTYLNKAFVVLAFVLLLQLADACYDNSSSCPLFRLFCESSSDLQEECPMTCNRCPQDPCNITNGGCDHMCSWEETVVTCSCLAGYRLAEDLKTCVDIDECSEGPNPCSTVSGSHCINNIGSYMCRKNNCTANFDGMMNYYKSDSCCALPVNETCGVNENIRQKFDRSVNGKIAGGEEATLAAWPWMVQLTMDGNHRCGGSLITPSWIVTSSNCVEGLQSSDIFVTLGHVRNAIRVFVERRNQVNRTVEEIIRHPSNVVDGFEQNNIALLRLSNSVNFTSTISSICLPCGEIAREGDKCWSTGFGVIDETRTLPEILQEVDLPVVGINNCIRSFESRTQPVLINRRTMLCAGYDDEAKGTCNGDGGGPLMCQRASSCQWYLAGITDFGAGCGGSGFGVYTNVLRFESWIRESIGNDADELCTTDHSPCRDFQDEMEDCRNLLDPCDESNRTRCALTCCMSELRRSDCMDNSELSEECEYFKPECENPGLIPFLQANCPRTCLFC